MSRWLMVLAAAAVGAGALADDGWLTDFEKAKARAKQENKHVLIDFSGSDWCHWCARLDKEVFQQDAFKQYAEDHLVLMLADFPRDQSKLGAAVRKQNEALRKEFGVTAFPTVFVLSPEGRVVGKMGYQSGGAEAYVEHIKKLAAAAEKPPK